MPILFILPFQHLLNRFKASHYGFVEVTIVAYCAAVCLEIEKESHVVHLILYSPTNS